jgi:hypothetical protein
MKTGVRAAVYEPAYIWHETAVHELVDELPVEGVEAKHDQAAVSR